MLRPYTPPTLDDICARWHHATVANRTDVWRAVSQWLDSEASMCIAYGHLDQSVDLGALSDLAQRRHLDLYPVPEPA